MLVNDLYFCLVEEMKKNQRESHPNVNTQKGGTS